MFELIAYQRLNIIFTKYSTLKHLNVLAFGILISETHVSTGNGIPVEFDIYIENTHKIQESVKLYFLYLFFVFEEKYFFFVL